jgi:hypothetical protein
MTTKPSPSGNTVHTPPHLIENVVRLLTPRIRRRDLLDELREDFETKPQPTRYVGQSARTLARLIPGTALTSFNAALVMAQAAVLVMSFPVQLRPLRWHSESALACWSWSFATATRTPPKILSKRSSIRQSLRFS